MQTELVKFERKAQNELREAEQALQAFIKDRLDAGRATMKSQLALVLAVRARQLSNLRAGEVVRSTRPAKKSQSRVAA